MDKITQVKEAINRENNNSNSNSNSNNSNNRIHRTIKL